MIKALDRSLLRLFFFLLGIWLVFVAWAQQDLSSGAAPLAGGAERPIVILHSSGDGAEARFVAQLAGRFGRAQLRPIESYGANQLGRFSAAFLLASTAGSPLPEALLDDLRRFGRPAVWIGWAPAAYEPLRFAGISYKGLNFAGSGASAPLLAVGGAAPVQTLAGGQTDDGLEAPWAVRSGNFTFFAEAPWRPGEASDRHLVFADLLFDILAPGAPPRRRALIRLEDINADTSPRRLHAAADLLFALAVPFELSLRNDGGLPQRLRQQPQLAAAIRYATVRGGSLVLREPRAPRHDDMPAAPYETVDGDGALVIPDNLSAAEQAARHLVVRDSMLSYSHRWDADLQELEQTVRELRRLGYSFIGPRAALRAAPPHARLPLRRASAVSLAAAEWLAALPWIDLPMLVALLALATAMWLGGEILLSHLDPVSLQRRRAHGLRPVKHRPRIPQVRRLVRAAEAAPAQL